MKDLAKAIASGTGLALFPLPSMALLPGQLLPLHIFEQRYREMCQESVEGKSYWVMGRLQPGHETEYAGCPPVYPIAGVGQTVGLKELDDGRWLVALRGIARVRIQSELPRSRLYRQVQVELLDDRGDLAPEVLSERLSELVRVSELLLAQMGGDVEKLRTHLASSSDPFLKLDMLAAAMAPGPASRQTMLETLQPLQRCDKLQEYLDRIVGDQEQDHSLN